MKTPMPILILDNTSTFGGAAKSLCALIRSLDKGRFQPVLVTGQPTEFLAKHFECTWHHQIPKLSWVNNKIYKKIASLRLFRFRKLLRLLNISRFIYWFLFVTIPESVKYFRLGRKHRVAMVHLNNIFGSQSAGILAAKLLRVPCVAHLRDFEEVHPVTRFYARLIDHHVAISAAVRENLLELGVPEGRITVVHDGIDLDDYKSDVDNAYLHEEFGILPGQPAFGIFGRIIDWKGIREFILAVPDVLEIAPEAIAFVVGSHSDGDEEYYRAMRQLTVDLGLKEKILFTGYREDVPALMSLMSVIVHASTRPEPFGMVIIEGMAMKKPVVATRGGGALDIVIDNETGFLVDMGDVKGLGRAIIALLEQSELQRVMGLAGRALVARRYSSVRYADRMSAIYQNMVAA